MRPQSPMACTSDSPLFGPKWFTPCGPRTVPEAAGIGFGIERQAGQNLQPPQPDDEDCIREPGQRLVAEVHVPALDSEPPPGRLRATLSIIGNWVRAWVATRRFAWTIMANNVLRKETALRTEI